MRNFKVHTYKVECKCGIIKTRKDNHFREDIVLIKYSFCAICSPTANDTSVTMVAYNSKSEVVRR